MYWRIHLQTPVPCFVTHLTCCCCGAALPAASHVQVKLLGKDLIEVVLGEPYAECKGMDTAGCDPGAIATLGTRDVSAAVVACAEKEDRPVSNNPQTLGHSPWMACFRASSRPSTPHSSSHPDLRDPHVYILLFPNNAQIGQLQPFPTVGLKYCALDTTKPGIYTISFSVVGHAILPMCPCQML